LNGKKLYDYIAYRKDFNLVQIKTSLKVTHEKMEPKEKISMNWKKDNWNGKELLYS
jgi:hypothetical protein